MCIGGVMFSVCVCVGGGCVGVWGCVCECIVSSILIGHYIWVGMQCAF